MVQDEKLFIMKEISKAFPGVQALDKVTFEVLSGEVHALVGENGAGKSTLIKILSGIYKQDSGQIIYKGQAIDITNPRQAQNFGISTIYQELNLCPNLTVVENIFLGNEKSKTILKYIDEKSLLKKASEYLEMLESDIDPRTPVALLSVAQQQIVEIAKALSFESKIIIMDEPTSSLSLHDTQKLFEIIKRLKKQGKSIIYISHRLEEVFEIADIVTVLRDGKLIGTKPVKEIDYGDIVRMMVGREIESKYSGRKQVRSAEQETVLLEAFSLTKKSMFEDISFHLKAGEILGFSGLVGAGRTELMKALFGIIRLDSGSLKIKGKEQHFKNPKDAIRAKIGMTSEDRKSESLFMNFTIKENITIAVLDRITRYGVIPASRESNDAASFIEKLNIKPPKLDFPTLTLSGGNQQKIAIAKWLITGPEILIMDEPTRGIDVGAKAEIYKLIRSLAEAGKGVIFVSSELPEILSLADRILVINKGKLVGEFLNRDASEEKIMQLAV